MIFFKKRAKEEDTSKLPQLPPLPRVSIPDAPERSNFNQNDYGYEEEQNSTLPSLPNSPIGERMNRQIVKEAITGRRDNINDDYSYEESNPVYSDYQNEEEYKGEDIDRLNNRPLYNKYESDEELEYNPYNENYSIKRTDRTREIEDPININRKTNFSERDTPPVRNRNTSSRARIQFREYSRNTNNSPPIEERTLVYEKSAEEPLYIRFDKYHEAIETFNEIKKKISEIDSLLKNIKEIREKEEKEIEEWIKEVEAAKIRLDEIDREVFIFE